MYLRLVNGQPEHYSIAQLHEDNPNISFSEGMTDAQLAAYDMYPYSVVIPAHDENTQTTENPHFVDDNGAWILTYDVRDFNQDELNDIAHESDLESIRERGKDVALLLIELIDWCLANTAMQPQDFSVNVRKAYQDIKPIADRLK